MKPTGVGPGSDPSDEQAPPPRRRPASRRTAPGGQSAIHRRPVEPIRPTSYLGRGGPIARAPALWPWKRQWWNTI